MAETVHQGEELAAGFSDEQLLALAGLRFNVKPSAWYFWREAAPEMPEVVDVSVASLLFDATGVIAVGVRKAEIARTIREYGTCTPGSFGRATAELCEFRGQEIDMFTSDGTELYPPLVSADVPGDVMISAGDPMDASHI
jgi:hypothetical protein